MYNATSKAAAIVLGLAILMSSCTDRARTEAQSLCDQAAVAVAEGQYGRCIDLLDTLDVRYRKYTDIRREGLKVREKALEGLTIDSIQVADARLAVAQIAADSLSGLMKFVGGTAGLEGYYVAANTKTDKQLNQNMVQGRVDPKGYFRLIANVGRRIGFDRVIFAADGAEYTVGPVKAERVVDVEGSQLLSFTQEEAAESMRALSEMSPATLTCTLSGSKGNVKINLNAEQTSQLLTAWRYAMSRQELEQALLRREKLERRLAKTRNHQAGLL